MKKKNNKFKSKVIDVIKNSLDLVLPLDTMPYREDYINKWELIKRIKDL